MSELQRNAPSLSLHEWCQSEEAQALVQQVRPELLALARHIALGGDGRRYAEKQRLPLVAIRRELEVLKQLQDDASPATEVKKRPVVPAQAWQRKNEERLTPPCTDDPEMFFSTDPGVIALAKEVCQRCGLQDPCLEASFALNELRYGIWGGLTPDERRALK